jgi:hypothetical protein
MANHGGIATRPGPRELCVRRGVLFFIIVRKGRLNCVFLEIFLKFFPSSPSWPSRWTA